MRDGALLIYMILAASQFVVKANLQIRVFNHLFLPLAEYCLLRSHKRTIPLHIMHTLMSK